MVDRLGSPAYSEEELAAAPDEARRAADASLVRNLAIVAEPSAGDVAVDEAASPPSVVAELNAEAVVQGPCLRVRPLSAGSSFLIAGVPVGGFSYASEVRPPAVGLRRFAVDGAADLAVPSASGTVAIPPDSFSRSWRATFELAAPTTICGPAAARAGQSNR